MYIHCSICGTLNWLENEIKCHACLAILRRCIDCGKFDVAKMYCGPRDVELTRQQAEAPSLLSISSACQFYNYMPRKVAARS